LEEDASPGQQVPLLISLAKTNTTTTTTTSSSSGSPPEEEDDPLVKALRKAVESGDPDLAYLALFAAYSARTLPQFWNMLAGRPPARHLFIKYAKSKVRGKE
jgi:hypothetical protein